MAELAADAWRPPPSCTVEPRSDYLSLALTSAFVGSGPRAPTSEGRLRTCSPIDRSPR